MGREKTVDKQLARRLGGSWGGEGGLSPFLSFFLSLSASSMCLCFYVFTDTWQQGCRDLAGQRCLGAAVQGPSTEGFEVCKGLGRLRFPEGHQHVLPENGTAASRQR